MVGTQEVELRELVIPSTQLGAQAGLDSSHILDSQCHNCKARDMLLSLFLSVSDICIYVYQSHTEDSGQLWYHGATSPNLHWGIVGRPVPLRYFLGPH